jgi:DNA-binding MarR family transcriptional regulator
MAVENDTAEAVRHAFVELLGAERRLRGRDRCVKEGELTNAQIRALFRTGSEGEATAGELARYADLSPASVTAMLDHLEEAGVVTRRRSDEDRRVVVVALTERGQELVAEKRAAWEAYWRRVLGEFPQEDLEAACRVMARLAGMLDEL